MKNLKIGDVRMRGCLFTLYPAAEAFNVDAKYMVALLDAAEIPNEQFLDEEREKRPDWPLTYSAEELKVGRSVEISTLIKEGLLTEQKEGNYKLTDKAISIFLKAASINEELLEKEFRFCPCDFM